jgi:hypothetical protein
VAQSIRLMAAFLAGAGQLWSTRGEREASSLRSASQGMAPGPHQMPLRTPTCAWRFAIATSGHL